MLILKPVVAGCRSETPNGAHRCRTVMQKPGKSVRVAQPKGVGLVLGAWNFPVNLNLVPLVGAIAAGNCCVVKPSEVSPASAKVIESIMQNHLDPRAYRCVQGAVKETTALLEQSKLGLG